MLAFHTMGSESSRNSYIICDQHESAIYKSFCYVQVRVESLRSVSELLQTRALVLPSSENNIN